MLAFMKDLPIRKVPGIGKVIEQILNNLGIFHWSQVIERATEIFITFTEHTFEFLIRACLGISRNVHEDARDLLQKSLSVSGTFKPISRFNQFKEKINEMAEEMEERARAAGFKGRALTISFKNINFDVIQK